MAVAATESPAPAVPQAEKKQTSTSTFVRVMRYSAVRLVTLFATVVVGVYLTIMIANMGGYVDQIMRNDIREKVTQQYANNKATQNMDPELRKQLIQKEIALEEQRMGLNTPIAVR
ncbi:MAG TPA: hypothetical protein VMJ64_00165, partial [Anaerolineales bacterium]|nr:hypothetical protein [Anaerolineales bacterium]